MFETVIQYKNVGLDTFLFLNVIQILSNNPLPLSTSVSSTELLNLQE